MLLLNRVLWLTIARHTMNPKQSESGESQTIQCTTDGSATLEVTKLEKRFNRPVAHQG